MSLTEGASFLENKISRKISSSFGIQPHCFKHICSINTYCMSELIDKKFYYEVPLPVSSMYM